MASERPLSHSEARHLSGGSGVLRPEPGTWIPLIYFLASSRALRARSILSILEIWMKTQSMLYCIELEQSGFKLEFSGS